MSQRSFLLISILCSIAVSPRAFAAEPPQRVVANVTPCLGIQADDARLACFERVTRAAAAANQSQDQEAAAPAVAAGPGAAAAAQSPAAAPSAAAAASAPPDGDRSTAVSPSRHGASRDADEASDIVSAVASIRELEPEQYVITLANGQVWHQVVPERYLLREGDRVRLYPTHWGTHYRLTTQAHRGFIQVERLK